MKKFLYSIVLSLPFTLYAEYSGGNGQYYPGGQEPQGQQIGYQGNPQTYQGGQPMAYQGGVYPSQMPVGAYPGGAYPNQLPVNGYPGAGYPGQMPMMNPGMAYPPMARPVGIAPRQVSIQLSQQLSIILRNINQQAERIAIQARNVGDMAGYRKYQDISFVAANLNIEVGRTIYQPLIHGAPAQVVLRNLDFLMPQFQSMEALFRMGPPCVPQLNNDMILMNQTIIQLRQSLLVQGC